MGSTWLPSWLEALGTALFAVVLVVHVAHATTLTGRARLWHGGHILMALGMVDMYAPTSRPVVGATAGETIFTLAAIAVAVLAAVPSTRGPGAPWMWLISAADLGAMAYMFAMMTHRNAALTVLLTAWFAIEAALWSLGALTAVARHEELVDRADTATDTDAATAGETAAATTGDGRSRGKGRSDVIILSRPTSSPTGHAHRHHTRSVRATLAVMSVGMGYMLLAMQFGMPSMPSMSRTGPAAPASPTTPGSTMPGPTMPGMTNMPGMSGMKGMSGG